MKLAASILLLFAYSAAAADVTKFKPRPAAVVVDSDTYLGILLSEEDFRKLLQDKIDSNAKIALCNVDRKVCARLQEVYTSSIEGLEEVIQRDNTWFSRNKGALGLLSGLVLGVGTSIAIVRAVNPAQ